MNFLAQSGVFWTPIRLESSILFQPPPVVTDCVLTNNPKQPPGQQVEPPSYRQQSFGLNLSVNTRERARRFCVFAGFSVSGRISHSASKNPSVRSSAGCPADSPRPVMQASGGMLPDASGANCYKINSCLRSYLLACGPIWHLKTASFNCFWAYACRKTSQKPEKLIRKLTFD